MKGGEPRPPTVFTIGHSTRSIGDFIEVLRSHRIDLLADVRTIPRSRHNPQFNRETLPEALAEAGIEYSHVAELGGLRHSRPGSPNTAWRNASFRGFADYMQTQEFKEALDALIATARSRTVAVMCAEAVPWRCHRSLIADALLAKGIQVIEILGPKSERPHAMTPWAKLTGDQITYPAAS